MIDVKTSIDIHCPIQKVADYVSDPDHAPEWYVNIHSAVWQTPKPLQVGSQIAFKARFLGRTLSYTYEVITLTPTQMVMRTAQGPFPMETSYYWESTAENETKMTLRNAGKPSGFSKLFAPFMSKAMRKANADDLRKLKAILEQKHKVEAMNRH